MEGYLQFRRLKKSIQHAGNDSDDLPERVLRKEGIQDNRYVDFDDNDTNNPRNWSMRYRLFCTCLVWNLVFVTGWASAADSSAHEVMAMEFHVSEVAQSLSTSMYLFGVGSGALLVGPISETVGRLVTYLSTFAVYLLWIMATALTPNFGAQIVFRLLAGFFSAASMSIYGGTLADMFEPKERASVWPFFALSPLLGPTVAPIVSGWIVDRVGWRWVNWVTLIVSGAAFLAAALCLPETFAPTILSFKASLVRQETKDKSYKSEHDEQANLATKLKDNLSRIVYFIFREPTTLLFGLYMTLLYMLIFGFLEGFDYIFTKTYDFSLSYRYTSFSAIGVGILLGLPYVVLLNRFSSTAQEPPPPEKRLKPAVFASALLPISLFWIGWTNRPDISYWSDLGACCLCGFALMALFTSAYHYLLDSYGTNAASAIAAITFMRYFASGGMVLATEPLYEGLTVKWMLTLLGCIAAVLTPVPWVFSWQGPLIRERSKWAKA